MTDQTNTTPAPAPTEPSRPQRCRGRGRGFFFITAIVLAAGLTGAIATKAFSEGFTTPVHWRGGGGMMGWVDPARIEDRADRLVKHLIVEVDGTPEQQDKLRGVVKGAVRDILPMREKVAEARLKARDLLTRPTIDRAEIEKLRSEQLALADTASKRFTQAVADAAEILTAEQRRRLNNLIPPRGGYMSHWHR